MQLFTLRNASLLPLIAVLLYALFILLLLIPSVQRNALYAHKLNPSLWQDLSDVEQFGFHQAQVIPFIFHPKDDNTIALHAWYMLPLPLYLAHESSLKAHHNTSHYPLSARSLTSDATSPFYHLLSNPSVQLIISFHGNAGHLASTHRPTTYQHLLSLSTPTRPVHVLAFDYRGFGLSSGSPSESGLISDATALLQLLSDAGLPLSRITLLGQSLGTAVATGALHRWTHSLKHPAPRALVLLASFSAVPSLMDSYSVQGVVPPLLSGLDYLPFGVKAWVVGHIADTWETGKRLADLWSSSDVELDLSVMHARDDWEIPWREGWRNVLAVTGTKVGDFRAGARGPRDEGKIDHDMIEEDGVYELVEGEADGGRKRIRWESIRHGGHDRVAVGEQMKALVLRSWNRKKDTGGASTESK